MIKKKLIKRITLVVICLFFSICSISSAAEYHYDKLNRVVQVTYNDGRYVTYTYDGNGNIERVRTFLEDGTEADGFTDEPNTYSYVINKDNSKIWEILNELEQINEKSLLKILDIKKLPNSIRSNFMFLQNVLAEKKNMSKQVGYATENQILRVLNVQ